MKTIHSLIIVLLAAVVYGCADVPLVQEQPHGEGGALLNLYIGNVDEPETRLSELPTPSEISNGQRPSNGSDKKNIGLYVYYRDDYDKNDLTKPYLRNLECKVENGTVVPLDNSDIYIYDRMTIVAFYPYNPDANDYTFKTKNDERKYPITESDYSYQYYIPYRAQASVDPTSAYHVRLLLKPVQTTKIQVVLLASDTGKFPEITTKTNGVVKLVPGIDPVDAVGDADKRENWVDKLEQPYGSAPSPASSGMHVRRYTTYIWKNNDPAGGSNPHHGGKKNHNDNIIKKGDVLFQSDKLTLFFPEEVVVKEGSIYRYGYNMDTGEIFIPTSENLVYDAKSLAAAGRGGYQVCDIDLTDVPEWTPVKLGGTYDGGGHAVKNMKIGTMPKDNNVGLFGSVIGNSLLKNLHLENPVINVDFSGVDPDAEAPCVGGLVGKLNKRLTPEELDEIIKNIMPDIPPDLPQSVINALIAELVSQFTENTHSRLEGCKVSKPDIKVEGENGIVGGLAGAVGNGVNYKGTVKDSYVVGGTISVNSNNKDKYETALAGAFAGKLDNGAISNSYTTATAEAYVKEEAAIEEPFYKEVAKGLANIGAVDPDSGVANDVSDSFTSNMKGNTAEEGVKEFNPDWPSWGMGNKWPVANSTLGSYWGDMGSAPSAYPKLVWETHLDIH